jgi:LytS/YehU family sensor histidine kinase
MSNAALLNYQVAIKLVKSHAAFNFLTHIQNQITFDHKRDALSSLSYYATFLRLVLGSAGKSMHSLKEEFMLIESYLTLEKIRFSDVFDFSISNGETTTEIPVFSITSFMEHLILGLRQLDLKGVIISVNYDVNRGVTVEVTRGFLFKDTVLSLNDDQQERLRLMEEKQHLDHLNVEEVQVDNNTVRYTFLYHNDHS